MKKSVAAVLLSVGLLLSAVPAVAQQSLFAEATTIEEILLSPDYRPDDDAQLLRYYIAFFNRQPDIGGAKYWLGIARDGFSQGEIAGFMAGGQEFANAYDGMNNVDYLERVYGNVLGRDFDQGGFDYWLDFLDGSNRAGGNPDLQVLSRSQVVFFVAQSVEFSNTHSFDRPTQVSYSGYGPDVVAINKPDDYFLVTLGHDGAGGNFIVWGVDAEGERRDLLANEVGPYEGRKLQERPDLVALEIRAEGNWSVSFEPVWVATRYEAGVLSGQGDDVVQLDAPVQGLTTADLTFLGTGNFIVKGYASDGDYKDLLVNEIGDFSGEVLVESGIQIIEIRGTEGAWTMQVNWPRSFTRGGFLADRPPQTNR